MGGSRSGVCSCRVVANTLNRPWEDKWLPLGLGCYSRCTATKEGKEALSLAGTVPGCGAAIQTERGSDPSHLVRAGPLGATAWPEFQSPGSCDGKAPNSCRTLVSLAPRCSVVWSSCCPCKVASSAPGSALAGFSLSFLLCSSQPGWKRPQLPLPTAGNGIKPSGLHLPGGCCRPFPQRPGQPRDRQNNDSRLEAWERWAPCWHRG